MSVNTRQGMRVISLTKKLNYTPVNINHYLIVLILTIYVYIHQTSKCIMLCRQLKRVQTNTTHSYEQYDILNYTVFYHK